MESNQVSFRISEPRYPVTLSAVDRYISDSTVERPGHLRGAYRYPAALVGPRHTDPFERLVSRLEGVGDESRCSEPADDLFARDLAQSAMRYHDRDSLESGSHRHGTQVSRSHS
jgi:hypothetical protein